MVKTNKTFISWDYKFEIFPIRIVVLCKKGITIKELYKESLKVHPELIEMRMPTDDMQACVFHDNDSGNIYLFITDQLTYSILVHECSHITYEAFEIMDSKHIDVTDEFYSYLLETIFKKISIACKEVFKLKLEI